MSGAQGDKCPPQSFFEQPVRHENKYVTTLLSTLNPSADNQRDDLFLPDFCGIRMVFAVVVIAQLLAFLLALVPLEARAGVRWRELGLISLFVQWAALTSAAGLCLARPYLARLSNTAAGLVAYLLMMLMLAIVSEAAYWVMGLTGVEPSAYWHVHFLARNLAMGAIINGLVLRYFFVQHHWRRNVRAESQARLQALQSRIRPHFLFNSMNTIASLTRSDPAQAETVTENLADLFRMSLNDARNLIGLGEELDLCRRYLYIEALRLGHRLIVDWDTGDLPAEALIPPLTLQPLLENAVYHGIEPMTAGGRIDIVGRCHGKVVEIDIANPAPGADSPRRNGNRLALDNVRERLAACFGESARVDIDFDNGQFRVRVRMPYVTQETQGDRTG